MKSEKNEIAERFIITTMKNKSCVVDRVNCRALKFSNNLQDLVHYIDNISKIYENKCIKIKGSYSYYTDFKKVV